MGITSLWPWPKVINFNRVPASAVNNHIAKTASKSVNLEFCSQAEPDTLTDTQTNWSENITPPRFRGGVKRITTTTTNICKTQKPLHLGPMALTCDLQILLWSYIIRLRSRKKTFFTGNMNDNDVTVALTSYLRSSTSIAT